MALFIYLEAADRVSWVKTSATGEIVSQGQGPLTGIEQGGERVIAWVPGEDVLLCQAEVPGQKRRLMAQAVPYALEEQLIDDVDTLHFALGSINDGQINVAVVSHVKMQQWLEQLQQAGLEPDQIIPDVLGLPLDDDRWQLVRLNERLLLRSGKQHGMVLDIDNAALSLRDLLRDSAEHKPAGLMCRDYSGAGFELPGVDVELAIEQGHGPVVELLASAYQEQSVINLLQGRYSRRERMSKFWRPWRAAAALLVVFVLVKLATGIVDQQQLAAEKTTLLADIDQIYRQSFPDARKVVNAKVQMERALASLRNGGSAVGAGFADLLAQAGEQFHQNPGLDLQRLSYKDGVLDVALFTKDLQQLDQLKQQLVDKAGMQVEIQSATAKGDRVEARLRIKGTAS